MRTAKETAPYKSMENLLKGVPPWKSVQWIRGEKMFDNLFFSKWVSNLNEETNEIKERIGTLDKEHKWELAKKMVNPYELIYTHNDERLPPSLSLEQPLSRSYFKMIEILEISHFFDEFKETRLVKTAHVAEGPGGFMQAIYNRAEYKKKGVSGSYAITLRPTSSHVPGWKKATAFLHKYKQIKILYGEDGTGDIYKKENQTSFIEACGKGVHLFTADGGFDFSVDYSCQEQKVFHLLVCSATIGLHVLQKGGFFVLKFFDCMSPHTQCLIVLLGRAFKEWTLYKPAMTRPCNSERYFVGKGYRGMQPELSEFLDTIQTGSILGQYPMGEAFSDAEAAFLQSHIKTTTEQQIASITRAIQLSENPEDWWKNWLSKCLQFSNNWCETFRVQSIPSAAYKLIMSERFPEVSLE